MAKCKVDATISDDYAALDIGKLQFYYGYEVTDPAESEEDEDCEWCFQAKLPGNTITIPRSQLTKDMWPEPAEILLIGIGYLIQTGELVVKGNDSE